MVDNYSNGRFKLYGSGEDGPEVGELNDGIAKLVTGLFKIDGTKIFSGESGGFDNRGHEIGYVDEHRVARTKNHQFLFRIAEKRAKAGGDWQDIGNG